MGDFRLSHDGFVFNMKFATCNIVIEKKETDFVHYISMVVVASCFGCAVCTKSMTKTKDNYSTILQHKPKP